MYYQDILNNIISTELKKHGDANLESTSAIDLITKNITIAILNKLSIADKKDTYTDAINKKLNNNKDMKDIKKTK